MKPTAADEISLDELRAMAARAGLTLADDELQRLLPGVHRSRTQLAALRQRVTDDLEPAGTFTATAPKIK